MPIYQASAVPLRSRDGQIEVCLITSMRKKRWGFPKGIIEPGDSPEETALAESDEEAGLFGEIIGPPIGSYVYSKWDTTLEVTVFLMRVERTADAWDEQDFRSRRWVTPEEAQRLLTKPNLLDLLNAALDQWADAGIE